MMIHWDYFATQQKLLWDKFIRDFQYIMNAICKVKLLLLDEENYEKCDHKTPKKNTHTKKNKSKKKVWNCSSVFSYLTRLLTCGL